MTERMKILIGYDGSECAEAARAHCSVEVVRQSACEKGGTE
jgi:hypothetical protein